jgi:hypothetical protein
MHVCGQWTLVKGRYSPPPPPYRDVTSTGKGVSVKFIDGQGKISLKILIYSWSTLSEEGILTLYILGFRSVHPNEHQGDTKNPPEEKLCFVCGITYFVSYCTHIN